MNYHIHSTRDLAPQDLINVISDLDMNTLGLVELKMIPAREGHPAPNYYYLDLIRRKLYEFYVEKREVPTLKSLLRALKKELKFKGSSKSLRKLLRKDGFHVAHRHHRRGRKHRSNKRCSCRSRPETNENKDYRQH